MAEMTGIKFKIWMARKLIKTQRKLKPPKKSKGFSIMVQDLKDETVILRKNQTELPDIETFTRIS